MAGTTRPNVSDDSILLACRGKVDTPYGWADKPVRLRVHLLSLAEDLPDPLFARFCARPHKSGMVTFGWDEGAACPKRSANATDGFAQEAVCRSAFSEGRNVGVTVLGSSSAMVFCHEWLSFGPKVANRQSRMTPHSG